MICRVCGTSFYHQTAVTTARPCECGANIGSVELYSMTDTQRADVETRRRLRIGYVESTLLNFKLAGHED